MKIEAGIPIPDAKRGGGRRLYNWPLGDMEIGDSFYVAYGDSPDRKRFLATARSIISRFGRVYGLKFATRDTDEDGVPGFRVWRID
jgi:hypothetical protein